MDTQQEKNLKELIQHYTYLDLKEFYRYINQTANHSEILQIPLDYIWYIITIDILKHPTCSDLATTMNVSKSAVSFILPKLVEGGLVNKIPSHDDKRQFHIEVTEKARHFLEFDVTITNRFIKKLAANMKVDEIAIFTKALKLLIETYDDLEKELQDN